MSVLRQFSWAAGSAIVLASSRFAFSVVLARKVPQELFGQYAYGQWIVDVSFLLCCFGVTGAASRYFAEHDNDSALLATLVRRWQWLAIGLPFMGAGSVVAGAKLSGISVTDLGLCLLASWALFAGLWAMQTAALIGMRRFDLIFRANAIVGGIMLVGVFILQEIEDTTVIFGLMTAACLCGALVGLLETNKLGRGEKRPVSPQQWRRMGMYALNCWVATLVSSLVWQRGEFPIVQTMLGDLAMAQYAAAFAVFGAAIQGIMLGTSGTAPHLTHLWGLGSKAEAIGFARQIMDLQLILTAIGTLFLIFFGTQLISIAFTDSYRDAADLLLILCLGLPGFVVSCQSFLLQLETDARFNRNVIFYGLFMLYFLAFLLVPIFGLVGAAIARVGAMSSIGLITLYYAIRYWGPEVASVRNFFSVVLLLMISAGLSQAVSSDEVMLRLFLMISAMFLSLVSIRNVAGQIAVRNLYSQLRTRVFGNQE